MAILRKDTIPAIGGAREIRIVTMSDGRVALFQGEEDTPGERAIFMHPYQAAEIAGFLWPADIKPKLN